MDWKHKEVEKMLKDGKTSQYIFEKTGMTHETLMKFVFDYEVRHKKMPKAKDDILTAADRPKMTQTGIYISSRHLRNSFNLDTEFDIKVEGNSINLTAV